MKNIRIKDIAKAHTDRLLHLDCLASSLFMVNIVLSEMSRGPNSPLVSSRLFVLSSSGVRFDGELNLDMVGVSEREFCPPKGDGVRQPSRTGMMSSRITHEWLPPAWIL